MKTKKKTQKPKQQYICCHCGRKMVYPVAHKCDTGFRKRHLAFIEISND